MTDRREFLKHALIATVVGIGMPRKVLGSLTPDITLHGDSVEGVYTLDLSKYPALQSDNGWVRLTIQGVPDYGDIFVTRVAGPKYYSLLDYCTHSGCGLNDYKSGSFYCQCHGSKFSLTGSVIQSPARNALAQFATVYNSSANNLQITIKNYVNDVKESLPTTATLRDVFPSPATSQATVEYALALPSSMTLSVFDISGREVQRVANGYRDAGVHNETVDVSHLPTGAYIFKLQLTTGVTVVKRFNVVR